MIKIIIKNQSIITTIGKGITRTTKIIMINQGITKTTNILMINQEITKIIRIIMTRKCIRLIKIIREVKLKD